MNNRGYSERLDDAELHEAQANLYDRFDVRHIVVTDEYDQNTIFYTRNVVALY